MILCFLCGAFLSAKYYEHKTNEIIVERCSDFFVYDCPEHCMIEMFKNYSDNAIDPYSELEMNLPPVQTNITG